MDIYLYFCNLPICIDISPIFFFLWKQCFVPTYFYKLKDNFIMLYTFCMLQVIVINVPMLKIFIKSH